MTIKQSSTSKGSNKRTMALTLVLVGLFILALTLILFSKKNRENMDILITRGNLPTIGIDIEDDITEQFGTFAMTTDYHYSTTSTAGSTTYYVTYYEDRDSMIKELSGDNTATYESLDPVENLSKSYYLTRIASDGETSPKGSFISWSTPVKVKGYSANHINHYYNLISVSNGNTSYNPSNYSSTLRKDCLIDLNNVSNSESGYILFSMSSSLEEYDLCEELNNMDTFEIKIIK